jgi:hypothetical protein
LLCTFATAYNRVRKEYFITRKSLEGFEMEIPDCKTQVAESSFEIIQNAGDKTEDIHRVIRPRANKRKYPPAFEDAVLQESSKHMHKHQGLSLVFQPKEEPCQHGDSPTKRRKK